MNKLNKKSNFRYRILPLLVIALLFSLYLLHLDLLIANNLQIGNSICNLNDFFDCESVSKSKFSHFLGLPVALYGVFYYSFLVLLTFYLRDEKFNKELRSVVLLLSFISIFPSLYLAYASFFIINKLCIFCSLLYLVNLILLILTFYVGRGDGSFLQRLKYGLFSVFGLIFFRFKVSFPLAILGVVLILFFGRDIYVESILEPRYQALYDTDNGAFDHLIEQWNAQPRFDFLENASTLKGALVVGSEDAPFTLVKFSDYQCPMCQITTPLVRDTYQENKNDLKIVYLSFPIHNKCNRGVDVPHHDFACELSKFVICFAMEDQARAYELHNAIMQEGISNETQYKNFIEKENLDESYCFMQDRVNQSLSKQVDLALLSDINGTPTFFLNGKRLTFKTFYQVPKLVKELIRREKGK